MHDDGSIARLLVSQVFATLFLYVLVPLKKPVKRNLILIITGALLITIFNALIIYYMGITFYIRFYFVSLVLPYFILFYFFAVYKKGKLIFALLSSQVIVNAAIINGLLASYVFYKENNPVIDTIFRVITFILFIPILYKWIRPIYLKMAESLNKGWCVLNSSMVVSYALSYLILFVPTTVFERPIYFYHAYTGIFLSLLVYAIIFFLFIEIKTKIDIEIDKQKLSQEFSALSTQSEIITTIAFKDVLTGINNRYSLFRQIDLYIENNKKFLLVFIDLDNLKEINDTYSHAKGDLYLKRFASALEHTISDHGKVYRFAGDEFVCLLNSNCDSFDVEVFRDKVISHMEWDLPFLGFSLGVSCFPNDGLSADHIINLADEAMYVEKKAKNYRR